MDILDIEENGINNKLFLQNMATLKQGIDISNYVAYEKYDGACITINKINKYTINKLLSDSLSVFDNPKLKNPDTKSAFLSLLEYFKIEGNINKDSKWDDILKREYIYNGEPKYFISSKNYYLHINRTNRGALEYFLNNLGQIEEKLVDKEVVIFCEWIVPHLIKYKTPPHFRVFAMLEKTGKEYYWKPWKFVKETSELLGISYAVQVDSIKTTKSSLDNTSNIEGVVYRLEEDLKVSWHPSPNGGLILDRCLNKHLCFKLKMDVLNIYQEIENAYNHDNISHKQLDFCYTKKIKELKICDFIEENNIIRNYIKSFDKVKNNTKIISILKDAGVEFDYNCYYLLMLIHARKNFFL